MKNSVGPVTFKKVFMVTVLLVTWIFLTVLYFLQAENLTGITDRLTNSNIISKPQAEFLKGQKIIIAFTAKENYLGQVLVRFYNYDRINSDKVLFRIREKGSSTWFYENIYKTDQFQPNGLFPFGFPIIVDSKGKSYLVEVESVKGRPEDAITLSLDNPLSTVVFQYPKKELLKDPHLLREFLINKLIYTQYNRDFFVALGVYLNLIILSLVLVNVFMQYLFTHKRDVIRLKGQNILSLGLVIVVCSAFLLYLEIMQLASIITIAGYLIITLGAAMLIVEVKKDSSEQEYPLSEKTKKVKKNNKQ